MHTSYTTSCKVLYFDFRIGRKYFLIAYVVADENVLIGEGEDTNNQNQPNSLESDRPPEELKAIESMAWPQCGQKPAWPKGLAGPRRLCQMQKKAFCQIRSKFGPNLSN